MFDDGQIIGGSGGTEIDDKIGVLGADLGIADAEAFEIKFLINNSAGGIVWRVFEN